MTGNWHGVCILAAGMKTNPARRRARTRSVRSMVFRVEQHLRLQRELLWHPRLGMVGSREPVAVRMPVSVPRSWIRR